MTSLYFVWSMQLAISPLDVTQKKSGNNKILQPLNTYRVVIYTFVCSMGQIALGSDLLENRNVQVKKKCTHVKRQVAKEPL